MTSDSNCGGNNAYMKETDLSQVEEITIDNQEAQTDLNGLQEKLDMLRGSHLESAKQISPQGEASHPMRADEFMSGHPTQASPNITSKRETPNFKVKPK